MKKIVLSIFLLFSLSISKSQFAITHMLGCSIDSVTNFENYGVKVSDNQMKEEFISKKNVGDNRIRIIYRLTENYKDTIHHSFDILNFKNDSLISVSIVYSKLAKNAWIKAMLKYDDYVEKDNLLYNKLEDIKVTVYDVKGNGVDEVIFLYSKKGYKTPEKQEYVVQSDM